MSSNRGPERSVSEYLIRYFKQYPCLYDTKDQDYKCKEKKSEAYAEILAEMKKHDATIELSQIETRIKSLKTQYGRELRQEQQLRHTHGKNAIYEPKLWCYNELSFLKPHTTISRQSLTCVEPVKVSKFKNEHRHYERRIKKLDRHWTQEETERLVEEVKMREELWNTKTRGYRDFHIRAEVWQEVADVMGLTRSQVVNKWTNLRNSFLAMHRKRKSKLYNDDTPLSDKYYMLAFLGDTILNTYNNEPADEEIQATNDASSLSDSSSYVVPKTEAIEIEFFDEDCSMEQIESIAHEIEQNDEVININENESTKFETLYEIEEHHSNDNIEEPVTNEAKSDYWQTIADFIAFNGRDWEQKHPTLANQFKTVIYKTLFDFQMSASGLDEPNFRESSA